MTPDHWAGEKDAAVVKQGLKVFTRDELAEHDGRRQRTRYVAAKGLVFDVTSSFLWQTGLHQGRHMAGTVLDDSLQLAPHGDWVFRRFPLVGRLADTEVEPMTRSPITDFIAGLEPRGFTEGELARFDGKFGRPAYVAYQGDVYDVTRSLHWRTGLHKSLHLAGHDLTEHLAKAPHGPEYIARMRKVGVLVEGVESSG